MNILGISCYYHDSAACLLKDGVPVIAVQEERLNRIKNSPDFPIQAINHCIQAGGLSFQDIDCVVFYEKPHLKFSRVIIDHLRSFPFSLGNFLTSMPQWLQDRLILPLVLKREIGYEGEVHFIEHHLSHAASTFLVSPFEEAAILTADGVGEWATMTYGHGKDRDIKVLKEMRYPDSLGLIYTAITAYLGFRANSGEGKTMGLASYGTPRYLDKFKEIIQVKPDGSFRLDKRYFAFTTGKRMYTKRFINEFGPEREAEGELDQRHYDIAASLQIFVEETLISIANHVHKEVGSDNLCLAGGLFLNCVANQRILEEAPFKRVFIQPASGDSGGALGAACYVNNVFFDYPRTYVMENAYLGTEYSDAEIKRVLSLIQFESQAFDEASLCEKIAQALFQGKIVGWFQGRMEFGPRSLGCRSILANPCLPEIQDILNSRVKHRESFRPFAPIVLEEKANEYFEMKQNSPFMLLAPRVREDKMEVIPGVTHVDGTARVQTLAQDQNPLLYKLIEQFEILSGVPVLVNTSLNLRGDPVSCSPEDALICFERSEMDLLVISKWVVEKILS